MPKDKFEFDFEGEGLEPLDKDGAGADDWSPSLENEPAPTQRKGAVGDDDFDVIISDDEPDQTKAGKGADAPYDPPPLGDPAPATATPDPEMEQMRAQMREMQESQRKQQIEEVEKRIKADEDAIAAKIETARANLQAAIEAGDSAKVASTQVEIGRLTADERVFKDRVQQFREGLKKQADTQTTKTDQAPLPAPMRSWLSRNAWFHDNSGKYAKHQQIAREIDKAVMADGFDMNHPRYYQELDKRIRERFKGAAPAERRNSPPTGGVDRGGTGAQTRLQPVDSRRIVLTRADLETMRTLNMDTTDKAQLRAFAEEKRLMASKSKQGAV